MDGLFSLSSARITDLKLLPSHRTTTSLPGTTTTTSPLPRTPLTSLFAGTRTCHHVEDTNTKTMPHEKKAQNENWVLRVLQMRSLWKPAEANNHHDTLLQEARDEKIINNKHMENEKDHDILIDEGSCDVCKVEYEDDKVEFDKTSFSKLLTTVSLAEARLYAKLAYLGSLSYTIPKIKLGNLLKRHRLRFVTSSLEKKAESAAKPKKEQQGDHLMITSPSTAYQIAASYLHSHIFKSSKSNLSQVEKSKVADDVSVANAKDDSVVVAANDEVKQSSVMDDDLISTCSSPCEWYICDDDENSTRYFVIQGSESLASWQANLVFEPIQFEAQVDVIVHRGIYEAAKVVYEQMLPRVHEHLQRHENGSATIRLTGHSLGGSLSLLINLMLLIRGQVPHPSCLLPVITFGAPWVMCGGDRLLHKLGLPKNHLQGITTHRDIVPRAFSCNYPTRVADLLKAVNGNFRNHPCLNNQNVLYAPMGELLILQPDAKVSPSHELLPSGSGLYVLRCEASEKQTSSAQLAFLNTPHPLHMILSEPSAAYASILRDHDVETYLTSIRTVIRQQLIISRRRQRQRRRHGVVARLGKMMTRWVKKESEVKKVLTLLDDGLKRLRKQMHLVVVVLVPARLFIMGTCNWMTTWVKFINWN
ncbi:hypothetical protein OSB04_022876 [Centaurea solstitialis]|uniref:Fungal lipase-type domain-containing protein n=1 Tax=Centaurea solstitialis TaxID=347529 RepID=A0AA38WAH7_9ASTR|nr:hypothetical protein OSB04_022876 [Centaurea solstitialis]